MQNFPKVYNLKIVFEENLLRSKVTVHFQKKMSTSKTRMFVLQFVSHNIVVVTKRIYFSSAFLKSKVFISDNIAGVVGRPQY